MSEDQDIVYLSSSVVNQKSTPRTTVISNTLSKKLLARKENWEVYVNSFVLDTEEQPIFIAEPKQFATIPTTDVNLLNYFVQLKYGSITATVFLLMDSVNSWNVPPTFNKENSRNYSSYFGIYTYGQFLGMLNTAFATALTNLQSGGYPVADVSPPFCTLNSESGILALNIPQTFVTNNVEIIMDQDMRNRLSLPFSEMLQDYPVMPTPNIAYSLQTNRDGLWKFVTTSEFFLSPTILPSQRLTTAFYLYPYYTVCTDHDYRAAWNDKFRIVVTSNLATLEAVPNPIPFQGSPSTQNSNLPILAIYNVDISGSDNLNGQITFSPFFKDWVSVAGSGPLQELTIEFQYLDRRGYRYSIWQTLGKMAAIRLGFRRRLRGLGVKRLRQDLEDIDE